MYFNHLTYEYQRGADLAKGLNIVSEGQRINLRIYQRFFYPITQSWEGEDYTVYSDTGREKEINYNRIETYGLDDPFTMDRLVRLARALNALDYQGIANGVKECRVTICTNKELFDPDTVEIKYVPFDPERLQDLSTKIKIERRKIEWRQRMNA